MINFFSKSKTVLFKEKGVYIMQENEENSDNPTLETDSVTEETKPTAFEQVNFRYFLLFIVLGNSS